MLDERSRASSSVLIRETSAPATPAETRDWVAEFRREQAHLIRAAPRRPSRLLSYGVGTALAAALCVALATLLPARLAGEAVPKGPDVSAGPAVLASAAGRPAAAELAEAREEALSFDLARARREAEAARTVHLREVEALRAAVARSEAGRERAEAAQATAEARGGALARDLAQELAQELDGARADLAAARREAAEARTEAAEGRDRAEQIARHRTEADALERERRATTEAALARASRERDEAHARLAEIGRAAPAQASAAASQPAALPVDWSRFGLRLSTDEPAPPAARDPRRPEPDRKTARRSRETADRGESAPRAGRGGRTKAGAERSPAPQGGRPGPELRLNRPGPVEPDA